MLEDALKSVKSAEDKASERLHDADERSDAILKKANDDAVQMKKNAAGSIKEKAAESLEHFRSDAENRKAEAAEKSVQEVKEMKAAAMTRVDQAVDALINNLA